VAPGSANEWQQCRPLPVAMNRFEKPDHHAWSRNVAWLSGSRAQTHAHTHAQPERHLQYGWHVCRQTGPGSRSGGGKNCLRGGAGAGAVPEVRRDRLGPARDADRKANPSHVARKVTTESSRDQPNLTNYAAD
jgi:hypothetical protein